MKNYHCLTHALKGLSRPKKEFGGCHNKKRVEEVKSQVQLLENPPSSLDDNPGWIAWTEEKLLGTPITFAKVDACDITSANTTCKEFLAGKGGFLVLAVDIQAMREFKIKRGKNAGKIMAFLTISDSSCAISDVCVFSEVWEEYGQLLVEGNTVLLQGERDKKKGSFVVKTVAQI